MSITSNMYDDIIHPKPMTPKEMEEKYNTLYRETIEAISKKASRHEVKKFRRVCQSIIPQMGQIQDIMIKNNLNGGLFPVVYNMVIAAAIGYRDMTMYALDEVKKEKENG